MCIILGHAAHSGKSVHYAALFVAVHGTKFKKAQRQVTVRTPLRPINEDVEGAVHRLQVVIDTSTSYFTSVVAHLIQVHGREHSVLVPREVTALFEQVLLSDVG